MTPSQFTQQVRNTAIVTWILGLVVIALDFLYLPVFEKKASISYIFFILAALLTAWAEKREFSTRIFLYRLHDATIFSPWKYLLLYFLWISLFSPFTPQPISSLLYAANGWLSLFTVGLTAQFLFCERKMSGVALLPRPLSWAFGAYCVTTSLLLLNTLLHLFLPSLPLPVLINEQKNLFLYFTIGLPFLIWDFLRNSRHLVPRWLSVGTIVLGTFTTMLIGRKFYQAAIAFSVGGVVALFLYKRIRPRKTFLLAIVAAGAGAVLSLLLLLLLKDETMLLSAITQAQGAMEEKMRGSFALTWQALVSSNYMGQGLGVTGVRGVWTRVLAEAGVVGFVLYLWFFVSMLIELYRVRHSSRVVVSNVAIISLGVFLLLVSHYVENPYGAYVWVWYAIWALFASTPKKKRSAA